MSLQKTLILGGFRIVPVKHDLGTKVIISGINNIFMFDCIGLVDFHDSGAILQVLGNQAAIRLDPSYIKVG